MGRTRKHLTKRDIDIATAMFNGMNVMQIISKFPGMNHDTVRRIGCGEVRPGIMEVVDEMARAYVKASSRVAVRARISAIGELVSLLKAEKGRVPVEGEIMEPDASTRVSAAKVLLGLTDHVTVVDKQIGQQNLHLTNVNISDAPVADQHNFAEQMALLADDQRFGMLKPSKPKDHELPGGNGES